MGWGEEGDPRRRRRRRRRGRRRTDRPRDAARRSRRRRRPSRTTRRRGGCLLLDRTPPRVSTPSWTTVAAADPSSSARKRRPRRTPRWTRRARTSTRARRRRPRGGPGGRAGAPASTRHLPSRRTSAASRAFARTRERLSRRRARGEDGAGRGRGRVSRLDPGRPRAGGAAVGESVCRGVGFGNEGQGRVSVGTRRRGPSFKRGPELGDALDNTPAAVSRDVRRARRRRGGEKSTTRASIEGLARTSPLSERVHPGAVARRLRTSRPRLWDRAPAGSAQQHVSYGLV